MTVDKAQPGERQINEPVVNNLRRVLGFLVFEFSETAIQVRKA
jgi:hypothetical protein